MARSAVRWLRACGPEPNTTRRCASGSASWSAATADTAAVRIDPGVPVPLRRHEQELAVLHRHHRARRVGLRVEPGAQRLPHGGDRGRHRERALHSRCVEHDEIAHSWKPSGKGSSESRRNCARDP
jgi:hypothetical protein